MKTMDFLETPAALDLKLCRYGQIMKLKVSSQGQGYFTMTKMLQASGERSKDQWASGV